MTEEEAQEYNRLVDEYNYLVRENEMLAAELELGINNCYTVTKNIGTVGNHAVSRVHFLADEISDADDIITSNTVICQFFRNKDNTVHSRNSTNSVYKNQY